MNPGYWSLHYIIGFPDKSAKVPPAMQSSWIGEVVDEKCRSNHNFSRKGQTYWITQLASAIN